MLDIFTPQLSVSGMSTWFLGNILPSYGKWIRKCSSFPLKGCHGVGSPINFPLAGIVFNECIRGSNRALWVKNNRKVYGRMCTNYPRTSASHGSFILVGHCGRISFSINAVPPLLWKPLIECRRTRGNAQETIKGQ